MDLILLFFNSVPFFNVYFSTLLLPFMIDFLVFFFSCSTLSSLEIYILYSIHFIVVFEIVLCIFHFKYKVKHYLNPHPEYHKDLNFPPTD